MKYLIYCLLTASLFCSASLQAQLQAQTVINEYSYVTGLPACDACWDNCISMDLNDASKFAVGDTVLIIQMQGASVNKSNDSTFGSVDSYGNAGNYEKKEVAAITGNTIEFSSPLSNQYNVEGHIQVISIPHYVNYTVPAGGITCPDWNGQTGGVIVFEVENTLTMDGNITAAGTGFRGGTLRKPNETLPYPCGASDYYYDSSRYDLAIDKGEGIADTVDGYRYGRGAWANGGGGGNGHNFGGAGGSNAGIGGQGGAQYIGCDTIDRYYAIGGYSLNAFGGSRLYLGGGGGAGHENNESSTEGADGGGIVMIEAPVIDGNGNAIIAKGDSANNTGMYGTGNDAAGGGGGGGTVQLQTNTYSSALSLDVRGGKGGNMDNSTPHGTGGGGGGGRLCLSVNSMPANLSTNISGGPPGVLSNCCSGSSYRAEAGQPGAILTSCIGDTSDIDPSIDVNLGPDLTLCDPPEVTLNTGLKNSVYDFTWYKDGSELTNAADSALTVSSEGQYVVQVAGTGCPDAFDTIQVNSETATPVDTTFCNTPASPPLEVQGSGGYKWYATPSGTTSVHTGSTFAPTGVTGDTTFYVEDTTQRGYTGFTPENKLDTSFNVRTGGTDTYLGFHAYRDLVIDTLSVYVKTYDNNLESFTVELRQCTDPPNCTNSQLVESKEVFVQGPCNCERNFKFSFAAGFDVPQGDYYYLSYPDGNVNLHWDDDDVGYDYSDPSNEIPDIIDLYGAVDEHGAPLGNWGDESYGFFYDWVISTGTPCARIPVKATKNCSQPVELLEFNGTNHSDKIVLHWKTGSEQDNHRFVVQRSENGKNFKAIGSVPGKGNSQKPVPYSFDDRNAPDGVVYYRLLQYDQDGTHQKSRIISFNRSLAVDVNVSPNPFMQAARVKITTEQTVALDLKVTGADGTVIESITGKQTNNEIYLGNNWAPGLYIVRAVTPLGVKTFKIVKRE